MPVKLKKSKKTSKAATALMSDHFSKFEPIIELREIDHLKPNPHNARTHTQKQLQLIARSIRHFGFINPVLISNDNMIVAGHGRYEAAKKLGLEHIPALVLDHLTDDDLRAYMLADNKLASLAGWDEEILAVEFQHLIDLSFDLDMTGFEPPEIDIVIAGQVSGPEPDDADVLPEVDQAKPTTSLPGDGWQLGRNRLVCANARDKEAFVKLMGDNSAQCLFSDPPYAVPINGHVCGSGAIKHPEFLEGSVNMSAEQHWELLHRCLGNASEVTDSGSVHFVCMDWRHIDVLLAVGREIYDDLLNICVWNKTNAGMGSLYRSQHEMICVFRNGENQHRNNIQLGRFGRNRSNVWTYPGVNTFRPERLKELSMHPTVKPMALVSDAIRDCTQRGTIVLDPFAGSGTTIIAAETSGRIGYALELDPLFVDVAVRRWEDLTGEKAIHLETGKSFTEMTEARTPKKEAV